MLRLRNEQFFQGLNTVVHFKRKLSLYMFVIKMLTHIVVNLLHVNAFFCFVDVFQSCGNI